MSTHRIAGMGMFLAIGLAMSYLESLIHVVLPAPGIKLGIANIVTMYVLFNYKTKDAYIITFLRVLISGVLFSGLNAVIFGLTGGILCIIVMSFLKRLSVFSIMGISMAGAVVHNIGQLIAAYFIIDNAKIIYYMPMLCIAGLLSGLAIGYISAIIIKRFQNSI